MNNYWKAAIFFVLFESIFWTTADNAMNILWNLILFKTYNHINTWPLIASLLGIIISIWFFKMFVQSLVEELK